MLYFDIIPPTDLAWTSMDSCTSIKLMGERLHAPPGGWCFRDCLVSQSGSLSQWLSSQQQPHHYINQHNIPYHLRNHGSCEYTITASSQASLDLNWPLTLSWYTTTRLGRYKGVQFIKAKTQKLQILHFNNDAFMQKQNVCTKHLFVIPSTTTDNISFNPSLVLSCSCIFYWSPNQKSSWQLFERKLHD